jgi:hypothetical protein
MMRIYIILLILAFTTTAFAQWTTIRETYGGTVYVSLISTTTTTYTRTSTHTTTTTTSTSTYYTTRTTTTTRTKTTTKIITYVPDEDDDDDDDGGGGGFKFPFGGILSLIFNSDAANVVADSFTAFLAGSAVIALCLMI